MFWHEKNTKWIFNVNFLQEFTIRLKRISYTFEFYCYTIFSIEKPFKAYFEFSLFTEFSWNHRLLHIREIILRRLKSDIIKNQNFKIISTTLGSSYTMAGVTISKWSRIFIRGNSIKSPFKRRISAKKLRYEKHTAYKKSAYMKDLTKNVE